jgi:hypothetical protein
VVNAILHARRPIALNAKQLANEIRIPIGWEEQR